MERRSWRLNVLVSRRLNGTLRHSVYRKPTRTDLYQHARSEHHPAQKRAVACTDICDTESLEGEIEHLKKVCRQIGYRMHDIYWVLYLKQKLQLQHVEPVGTALLPFQHYTSNRISRLLAKHSIRTIHIPARRNIHMLGTVKDNLGLKVPRIYRIPCKCGKVYVEQTGKTNETRYVLVSQIYAVAEHSIEAGHNIDFDNIIILGKTGYMDCLVKEAIEFNLHPNRDGIQ